VTFGLAAKADGWLKVSVSETSPESLLTPFDNLLNRFPSSMKLKIILIYLFSASPNLLQRLTSSATARPFLQVFSDKCFVCKKWSTRVRRELAYFSEPLTLVKKVYSQGQSGICPAELPLAANKERFLSRLLRELAQFGKSAPRF